MQADVAFKELKKMMSTAPILASLLLKEPMLLYIAATNRVVSAVVVEREEEGKTVQRPVYYLSEVLSTSKQNYPHYQKMTYGVYMASKKLKHYFREHPIRVVAKAPISEIISNKDTSGWIAKWAIVGDMPNRYTSDVVLNQQARVAHQGWYGGFAIPGGPVAEVATAVLDAGAYGRSRDRPMADC
jgi:hypothetical protein